MKKTISQRIAEELSVNAAQVDAAIKLLDEGATVPFIARYRKEATGALDDTRMRLPEERYNYLQELEDLYLPYKPRRRSKALIAREAGLGPLADALLEDPNLDPVTAAGDYINESIGVPDNKAALDGARQILMERFAEDADLLSTLRQFLLGHALLASRLMDGKAQEGAKFRDYFAHTEALAKVPSHRALAMFRGSNEGVLSLNLIVHAEEKPTDTHPGPTEARRPVAAGDCALDLASLTPDTSANELIGPIARKGRERGHPDFRRKPERPAIGSARLTQGHHRPRPGFGHRGEGGGGRCKRQNSWTVGLKIV